MESAITLIPLSTNLSSITLLLEPGRIIIKADQHYNDVQGDVVLTLQRQLLDPSDISILYLI